MPFESTQKADHFSCKCRFTKLRSSNRNLSPKVAEKKLHFHARSSVDRNGCFSSRMYCLPRYQDGDTGENRFPPISCSDHGTLNYGVSILRRTQLPVPTLESSRNRRCVVEITFSGTDRLQVGSINIPYSALQAEIRRQ